ncbi:MAG: arginine N-succinyltransferase [Geminicoccales bacterium]
MTTETIGRETKLGCLPILGIILATVFVTAAATLWLINNQLFANTFEPVELTDEEEQVLSAKLEKISVAAAEPAEAETEPPATAAAAPEVDEGEPEPYSEDPSKRRIELSERELNALLAKGTDLAERLVIDLAEDVASAKLLIDLDPDFPFLGGKTLKVSAGAELAYQDARPIVILKGVSVWGVPLPNAWLGGLKNVDLISEFGAEDGFWKAFADGIKNISIQQGHLLIELNE